MPAFICSACGTQYPPSDAPPAHCPVCEDDTDAIIRATVLAIGASLDMPEDDPERRIAIINDAGREIGNVPVYSKPSYGNPAK